VELEASSFAGVTASRLSPSLIVIRLRGSVARLLGLSGLVPFNCQLNEFVDQVAVSKRCQGDATKSHLPGKNTSNDASQLALLTRPIYSATMRTIPTRFACSVVRSSFVVAGIP
jgi:hypothetical protein